MRKFIVLAVLFLSIVGLTSNASAIEILYKNRPIEMDVQAQIIGGRTLVPIRAINTALKGNTSWDQKKQ